MKHRHTALLVMLFTVLCLPAWAQSTGAVSEISIVTPEWENQTNRDGTGLFFEIVKRVYEPQGIHMSFKFVPWSRAQKLVSSNQADAMLCVWKEHAREEGQLLPEYPMFVEYTAAVVKKKTFPDWKGLQSLTGTRAVWLRGYDYHQFSFFKDVRLQSWHEVTSYGEAWELLEKDRYDVYIDALIDLENHIRDNHVDMKPFRLEVIWGEKAYVAFAPTEKSGILARIYDKRIMELFRSGELKSIYKKWKTRFPDYAWTQ